MMLDARSGATFQQVSEFTDLNQNSLEPNNTYEHSLM